MPELPEVETTVRGLAPVLEGRRIARVTLNRGDLRRPFPADLGQRLTGATVTSLGRRAKYGLIGTDRGDTLVFHLGMSGRWRIDPAGLGAHDHVLIDTDAHRLALNDPRRFGSLDLVPSEGIGAWPPLRRARPRAAGPRFHAGHLARAFADRVAPVKALLLDQRIVAGLGNIYVCEALHMAGISPRRAAGRIAARGWPGWSTRFARCWSRRSRRGGSTLRDYARPSGELGYFAKQWRVYGREGEPCACGGIVERRVDGGRSTFWCPKCQR
ncbi:MAG: bifunctional DNA-formamidopyrimidine glycosylase/DNA-(apurinic or apyrimidinic site) lyase [Sphingomonas sp.]